MCKFDKITGIYRNNLTLAKNFNIMKMYLNDVSAGRNIENERSVAEI